jgi:hypothetical protein
MHRRYGIIVIALMLLAGTAFAKTENRYSEGVCESGGLWWNVATYVDGRLTESHGIDCSGKIYHTHPTMLITRSSNPGGSPTQIGTCGSGAWWAVTDHTTGGVITSAWGEDCAGLYWEGTYELEYINPEETMWEVGEMQTEEESWLTSEDGVIEMPRQDIR